VARAPRKGPPATAEEYARCRTLGHAWDPVPVVDPPSYGIALDLRCIYCHTVRRDTVSRSTYALLSRRYFYPDHYKDEEQHSRQDWRALWVTTLDEALRALGHEDEPPLTVKPRNRSTSGKRLRSVS
jgi:hypothetical protein